MNWIELRTEGQVKQILEESKVKPILIFKHSRRCSVSRVALDRLERNWKESEAGHLQPYFIDLISYRDTSDTIASQFGVEHESPQVLLIENGISVYDRSHFEIDYAELLEASRAK